MNSSRDSRTYIVTACSAQVASLITPILSPLAVGGLILGMGLDEIQAGSLITAELLIYGLVSLFAASFVSRVSIRALAFWGALVMVGANLLSAQVNTLTELYLIRAIAGVANGLVFAAANATAARSRSPSLLFSLGWGSVYVLVSTSSLAISMLVETLTHSLVFYCYAFIIALMVPALWRLPKGAEESQGIGFPRQTLAPGFALLCGTTVIVFSMMAYYAFVERIAANVGASASQSALVVALAGIGGLIGGFSAAAVSSRFGIIRPLVVTSVFHALAIAVACFASTLNFVAGGAMAEGLMFIMMTPLILSLAAEIDAEGVWAAATGGVFTISAALGPVAGGALIQSHGHQSLAWPSLIAVVPGCLAFLWVHRSLKSRAGG